MARMTERSRVLARYGPDVYKDVFKVGSDKLKGL
jgi:hypothetical protein